VERRLGLFGPRNGLFVNSILEKLSRLVISSENFPFFPSTLHHLASLRDIL
jgi:hypothetical protein